MINNMEIETNAIDVEEIIKVVGSMAEVKQMMFKYGIYDVERNSDVPGAHVQKLLLERIGDESNKTISFIPRSCDTYPYEGRININNVNFYALYTIDELVSYVRAIRD